MNKTNGSRHKNWVLYKFVNEYSLDKYNGENKTNYTSWNLPKDVILESYSDEPRIPCYPEKVIHSYNELLEFVRTGYTDEEGKHYEFYYDENRYDTFMPQIEQFFKNHPDGIIDFG